MTDLPSVLRAGFAERFALRPLSKVKETGSEDSTRKFLFRLSDGQMIETVLIPASPALYGERSDRRTVCISSQVGCAYGCKFCASGLDGLKRNLTAGEIVAQFLAVEELSRRKDKQHCLHGNGRAICKLSEPDASHRHSECAMGNRTGSKKHDGINKRTRSAHQEFCRPTASGPPRNFPPRRHGRRARKNHAGQSKVSTWRAARCVRALLLAQESAHYLRIHPHSWR